jgi:cytochrome oxidase assembly protein ShyY1
MTPFWRRPIWILGHLVALLAVLIFVRCGIWQIDRLHEKQARNRLIAERSDGPAVDIDTVPLDQARYQRVRVTGRFDDADHVVIRNRAFEGTNGLHLVTPFVRDDGSVVLVLRGWIGSNDKAPPSPKGELTIEGLLLQTQTRVFGPKDPPTGHLDVLARLDVARIAQQLPGRRVYPLYLQLTKPAPPRNTEPDIVEAPARDEGPHRSYAIQWFLFAGVVLVGYPLLMRRRAREERDAATAAAAGTTQERDPTSAEA